jgi:hypothetical protein
MSKLFNDKELIMKAIYAIDVSCGDRCISSDNCDCSQIAKELEQRFLNV